MEERFSISYNQAINLIPVFPVTPVIGPLLSSTQDQD